MTQVVMNYSRRHPGKSKSVGPQQLGKVLREGRIAVMAAMETGNFDRARMLLAEIGDEFPEFAESLRLDIIESYNLTL